MGTNGTNSNSEFISTSNSSYSTLSLSPSLYTKKDTDPTQCCLPGKYLNCPGDNSNCPLFMIDRCSKGWDSMCDIYTASLPSSPERDEFIRKVTEKKFFTRKGCNVVTEQFDPTDPASPYFERYECPIWGGQLQKRKGGREEEVQDIIKREKKRNNILLILAFIFLALAFVL